MGAPLSSSVPVDPDDVVALPYSSGTTGVSKGVMLTHRNLIANIAQVTTAAQIRSDERFIAVLPFFHIYGMQVIMNTTLAAGATVAARDFQVAASPSHTRDASQRRSATGPRAGEASAG